ncbi:MAG: hypothetical protein FFODKBPE_00567 [Candidatus Argoarchaeum ethanivorans]|uniref:Uncharacterized protein n=1 Tax=Candidatus Argoarchaeum ethanivorans TaxID=2608793 RepID=A0A811TDM0_9EURY|nr:MAG: hypothetical protein FFODKBPE_00567 [Candidatus Argoarchaeum ethanivorans]
MGIIDVILRLISIILFGLALIVIYKLATSWAASWVTSWT